MLKVTFLGDISFNDEYVEQCKRGENPFLEFENQFHESNYVVGNLECMAEGDCGVNELKIPRLSTTLDTLSYLNNLSVNIVSLAQNHVYDNLEDGFLKTTTFLRNNNIQYLGAGLSEEDARSKLIIENEGIKLGILNFVSHDTNPNLPSNCKVYLNYMNIDQVIVDIIELKKTVDQVVLLLHWGGRVEGGYYPDWSQPKLARQFIDAGADLIIGHHSHTVQPYEVYKGKHIFYSLGNFCFSDYYFNGKLHPLSARHKVSLVLSVDFFIDKYEVSANYFNNDIVGFSKLDGYKSKMDTRNLIFKFLFSNKIFWRTYFFNKKYVVPIFLFFNRGDLSVKEKVLRLVYSFKRRFIKFTNV